MLNAVCIGGGSQDAWLTLSTEQVVEGFGFGYNSADPLDGTYQAIAQQYNPYTVGSKWYPGFLAFANACMRTRAILFCNSEPGDCTAQSSSVSASALETTQELGAVGQSGLLAAIPVVGQAAQDVLNEITQVFAQHAQAEARQSTALCRLAPELTANIIQIDAGVSSGRYDPFSAGAAIAQMANQFQSAIASLTKNCNAFCMYTALIKCLAEATPYYYQAIAPVAAPANPTISSSPSSPSPTNTTGFIAPVSAFPVSGTISSSPQLAVVAPTTARATGITISMGMLVGLVALVIVGLLFFMGGSE